MFDQAVLDNFNRADENPLSLGGTWKATTETGPSGAGSGRLVSNQYAGGTTVGKWHQNRYEGAGPFTDSEAYVTLAVVNEWHVAACRLQSVTSPSGTASGYFTQWAPSTIYLVRKNGASAQTILGSWSLSLSAGDKLGIRAIGTTIAAWYYKAGAWTMAGSATDATYASGYLGIAITTSPSTTVGRMDDFGGGAPVTASTFIPQIIVS